MKYFELWMIVFVVFLRKSRGVYGHPDASLNIMQLIRRYGYPAESHEITTEDGYMLTMYRIPHGKSSSETNLKPVLMMHGLYGQAENYIISGMSNSSMAYYLADNNFDVWLGNTRGNQHGRKHRYLDPNEKEFWNFSYHEIGMYDLPAKIDYILQKTKKKQIYYVGHSQGGTSFYIMNSERPKYQEKITTAALLAPAGFMSHFRNPVILPLASVHEELVRLAESTQLYELPPRSTSIPRFLHYLCKGDFFRDLCLSIYHTIVNGGDSGEFDKELLPLVFKFVPSVSARQPLHFAQSIVSGRFRQWDYGPARNLIKYGTTEPPDYSLRNITVPIAIYYSSGDFLVFPKDAEDTCKALGNCVKKHLISNPKWTHLDFLFATNGLKMLHNPVLKFFEKYGKS